ncbi:MAG TPA: RidA family protein [Casimicrobiaceae bacterium]|nr:RidA family protein [Casimicrobiaceae bacterium]
MAARAHRQSFELPGVTHAAPIPMAARVGNMVFSSGIAGKDPATDTLPLEPEREAQFAFDNMKRLLEIAGSGVGDVGHMTVFINDNAMRDHVNREWLKHFPDEHDRPARHTILQPNLPGGMRVQIEIIAVVAG